VKDAWKEYEAKPEYKEFNKHDMIESMQPQSKQDLHLNQNKNAHIVSIFYCKHYFNNGGTAS
jgi:hypothetical protein